MSLIGSRFSFALLIAVLGLALVVLAVWPTFQDLRNIQRELFVAKAQLARDQEVKTAYDKLDTAVGENATTVARAEKAIPTLGEGANDTPQLLLTVEALAEKDAGGIFLERVDFSDVSGSARSVPGAATPPHELRSRTVTIEGLGTYESILRFLGAIHASLRILEPQKVSFTTSASQDVVPFSITLKAFVQMP